MDPQLRLLLECSWDALGDAGYRAGGGLGAVGVFTGASRSDYLEHNLAAYRLNAERDPIGRLQAEMGTLTDYFPQQLAYRLDLTGPAVAVQAACATSLVAVHLAAQALLSEECDAALAGGASLIVPQGRGYLHVPDAVFSADGHTRAFGGGGTGMVHSQGVGVVVLRRLADALADGDPIYAIVRGSAVNHDGGGKAGFTAPSAAGQARAIAEALAVADLGVDAVDLIEAHGTATALGDQIELSALAAVFADRTAPQPIALGSVKSNIGHTNSAAGIASLIKTALALSHRRIPATLHARPVHSDLERHRGLLEVVEHTRDWPERDGTRIAGVSSFGIGGVNCHAVLEQAPVHSGASDPDPRAQLLLVSAVTEAGCREQIAWADADVTAETRADYAYTVSRGLHPESGWRATALLSGEEPNPRPIAAGPVPSTRPDIVFAFPGAGAQYPGMGAGLYRDEPVFAAHIDDCAEAMQPLLNYDIRDIVSGRASRHDVDDVRYGQPALFAVSLATAATLRHYGIEPDGVIGHSLGEYAAAVVAGVLSLPDAARLVAVRSGALADAAPGAMLIVALGEEDVRAALARYPEIALAAVNGPDACVVSGPVDAIETLSAALGRAGIRARRLRINAALHSPAVAAVVTPLRTAAENVPSAPATLPLYSTRTGRLTRSLDAEHWARHLREPVLFAAALQAATAAAPTIFVQVGPGSSLAALARGNASANLTAALSTLAEPEERTGDSAPDRAALLTTVGHLWCSGATVDVEAMHRRRRRTRLPVYPFQRRSLWIDPHTETQTVPIEPGTWSAAPPAPNGSGPQPGPDIRIEVPATVLARSEVQAAASPELSTVSATREPALPNGRPAPTEPSHRPEPPTRNGSPQPATSLAAPAPVSAKGALEATAPAAASEPLAWRTFAGAEEEQIVALWEELLGERIVGAEADFFALGGTSMLATRMLDILNEGQHTDIRMRELLTHSTVAAFSALLRGRRPASPAAATPDSPEPPVPDIERPDDVAVVDATFPLTRVQHAYWVGRSGAFGLSDVSCHIYLEYDCDKLDLDRYEQAWNRLIRRHEMLRAVITEDGRNQILTEVPEFGFAATTSPAPPARHARTRCRTCGGDCRIGCIAPTAGRCSTCGPRHWTTPPPGCSSASMRWSAMREASSSSTEICVCSTPIRLPHCRRCRRDSPTTWHIPRHARSPRTAGGRSTTGSGGWTACPGRPTCRPAPAPRPSHGSAAGRPGSHQRNGMGCGGWRQIMA